MDVLHPSRPVPVGAMCEASGQRVPRVRSRVTNDPSYLPGATGQRALDRRRRDLVRMFLAELPDVRSDLALVAVRKAAELTVAAEMARAAVLNGGSCAADLDMLVKLEGEARRAVRALGLKLDAAKPSRFSRAPPVWSPLRARLNAAVSPAPEPEPEATS